MSYAWKVVIINNDDGFFFFFAGLLKPEFQTVETCDASMIYAVIII